LSLAVATPLDEYLAEASIIGKYMTRRGQDIDQLDLCIITCDGEVSVCERKLSAEVSKETYA
jgi:hypothetical protein